MFLMIKVRMVVTSIICGNLVIMIFYGYIVPQLLTGAGFFNVKLAGYVVCNVLCK